MENNIKKRIGKVPLDNGFSQDEYWVWGSSAIKGDDGLYHQYVSRWPKRKPFFTTWMTDSEIVHVVAKKATGPFEFSDVALTKRGPQYWDGQSSHNPKIVRYKDKYALFYMGSTHPFEEFPDGKNPNRSGKHCVVARSNKRVGVAISDSPYGPWKRSDKPILETKPNTFYSFLTSNPSPIIEEDGSVLMMFKARAYDEKGRHGKMTIGVARSPGLLGPYEVIGSPIFDTSWGEIEDPNIWKDDLGYHMLAKDMGDNICGEKQAGFLAHSKNGIDWELDEHPLAYSKTITYENGEQKFMGQLERVFPLVENGKVTTLYFAAMNGHGGFDNGTKSWNMAIPLNDM